MLPAQLTSSKGRDTDTRTRITTSRLPQAISGKAWGEKRRRGDTAAHDQSGHLLAGSASDPGESASTLQAVAKVARRDEKGTARTLRVRGACAKQSELNADFLAQGVTADNRTFYQSEDGTRYLYFDKNCNGKDGTPPRWIFDDSKPNTTAASDLDQDGDCKYGGRINSAGLLPPTHAVWRLNCADGWGDITLYEEGEGAEPRDKLQISGACDKDRSLNTAFVKQGVTADNKPYYQSKDGSYYLYYDKDCSGDGRLPGGWIFGHYKPSRTATSDLDGDGDCIVYGIVGFRSTTPPKSAVWALDCVDSEGGGEGEGEGGGSCDDDDGAGALLGEYRCSQLASFGWCDDEKYAAEVQQRCPSTCEVGRCSSLTYKTLIIEPNADVGVTHVGTLQVQGWCARLPYLNTVFVKQGVTADNKPYYRSDFFRTIYLYFDEDCAGEGIIAAGWIFGYNEPSTTATSDLDGKNLCGHIGRMASNSTTPPDRGEWIVDTITNCGSDDGRTVLPLTIEPVERVCPARARGRGRDGWVCADIPCIEPSNHEYIQDYFWPNERSELKDCNYTNKSYLPVYADDLNAIGLGEQPFKYVDRC